MALFSDAELAVVQALALGKKVSEEDRELIPGLKAKLNAGSQAEIPDRFVAVTGWANPAKDYPA